MVINPKKSPYRGLLIFVPAMVLVPVALTAMFHYVIDRWQPYLSDEMNWASARIFGCGLGICFHIGCILTGAFTEDFEAVKKRLAEFFANITVSARLAFRWYWEDVKKLGLAFWIDAVLIGSNVWFFIDAVRDFLILNRMR